MGATLVPTRRLLTARASLGADRAHGLQAPGSEVTAPGWRARGQWLLFTPLRVGSSGIRDRTRVFCTGRPILYH